MLNFGGFMLFTKLLDSVMLAKAQDYDTSIQIEKDHNLYGNFDEIEKEETIIKSFDGYELSATYIPLEGSNKYVIISHGYTYTRMGSVKYALMFRRLGFNCLIYDDRGCGKNKQFEITMGYNESRDLLEVIKYLRARFSKDIYLGLHGESLGAALSLIALEKAENIRFLVSDCGFCDLYKLFVYQCKIRTHLPGFVIKGVSRACKKKYGFRVEEVSPYKSIRNTKTPICFFHGKNDTLIPYEHCKILYDSCTAYKEIHLVENADHAQSFVKNQEDYEKTVKAFLAKIDKK